MYSETVLRKEYDNSTALAIGSRRKENMCNCNRIFMFYLFSNSTLSNSLKLPSSVLERDS